MIEVLQFAASSWWNLFVTLSIIIAPYAPISALQGLVRITTLRSAGL